MTVALAYYLTEWVIRIVALCVVPLRRTPAAARGWLLLIFFMPVAGVLLILAIGRPRFPRWRRTRFRQLLPFFADVAARLDELPRDSTPDNEAAVTLARRLGHLPAVAGSTIELIADYDLVVDRLVADVERAQTSVRLLVYLFADDPVGQRVIEALAQATERGVTTQVILDPVGSHRWLRGTLRRLRAAGVDVQVALPFRWLRGGTRRDMRNHRKLFMIDGRIGYAGSQNIVAADFRPGVVNHELVVRATGPIVTEMEAVFRGDWFLETGAMDAEVPAIPAATGSAQAQLLPTGADYPLEGFETFLVWQLHLAVHRVVIVTPYFVPDDTLVAAVRTAAARGVSIDLVLSAVVDQRLVNWAQASYYDELLSAGVRIHLYRHYLLHAKNVSIDGRLAIVGSSNVDLRSFELNEEVNLLLYDAASIAALEDLQRGYLADSDPLELGAWRNRPAVNKGIENVARLLGSLL